MKNAIMILLFILGLADCKSMRPIYRPNGDLAKTVDKPVAPPSDHHSPAQDMDERQVLAELMAAGDPGRCAQDSSAGRPVLRQLSSVEYANTIRDLLKLEGNYTGNLPGAVKSHGFSNNLDLNTVKFEHASAYLDNAMQIAQDVIPKLPELVGCSVADGEVCAQKFLNQLAPRLWRRPLIDEEQKEALGLYKASASQSSEQGMKAMISSLLFSPQFIYRSEIGKDGLLTAYELASALSYFIWRSAPDTRLWELASNGSILTNEVLMQETNRLLDDPRSKILFNDFAEGWLAYRSVLSFAHPIEIFPQYTPENRKLLAQEVEDTFDFWVRNNMKFKDMFVAEKTLGAAPLATYYKVPAITENGVSKLDFKDQKRRGVMGFASILASQASSDNAHPVKRGQFIMERIVCSPVDPTPPNVDNKIGEGLDASATNRERFAKHSQVPACAGCHLKIDGIGFGMEDYDGIGLYRSREKDRPIDSKGMLVGVDDKNIEFDGLDQLSQLIANSAQSSRCFTLQWFRYSRGHLERKDDVCAIRNYANEVITNNLSVRDTIVKAINHPSYRQRKGQ